MLTKQLRELERQSKVVNTKNNVMKNQKNYWEERYENLPNYIVVGQDMDGIIGYTVIHKKDEEQYRSGSYNMGITYGLSMSKLEMQKLADKMNKNN